MCVCCRHLCDAKIHLHTQREDRNTVILKNNISVRRVRWCYTHTAPFTSISYSCDIYTTFWNELNSSTPHCCWVLLFFLLFTDIIIVQVYTAVYLYACCKRPLQTAAYEVHIQVRCKKLLFVRVLVWAILSSSHGTAVATSFGLPSPQRPHALRPPSTPRAPADHRRHRSTRIRSSPNTPDATVAAASPNTATTCGCSAALLFWGTLWV